MTGIEKLMIGALGGLSAVLVKFLGQDYANVVSNVADLTPDQLLSYQVGYGLLTPILMFLGAFIAWISEETKRMKLVAIAVAAPAMITTWSGGYKTNIDVASVNLFMPVAYAEDMAEESGYPRMETGKRRNTFQTIKDGVGTFFGYNKTPQSYWVIVGAFDEETAAQRLASRLNQRNPSLNAWVGPRASTNASFPVLVGRRSSWSDAKELRDKAMETGLVDDAYLSPGPD